MKQTRGFFDIVTAATAESALRYALFCGIAWLVAYVFFRRRWLHRKIIQRFPPASDIRREIKDSAISLLIFAIIGALTVEAARKGWTQMYWRNSGHGPVWFWTSIGLTILLHDTWFYWTHRLLHHPKIFRYTHLTHHRSTNPTPWAAYAFSPVEAVLQASIFPLAVLLIPLHPYAFALFMIWQLTFNVIGHTGFEFHPRWFVKSWLGRVMNTPTNHIMHHEKLRGNYGLYFNVWDRLMGTNHKDYETRFEEVMTRPRTAIAAPAPASASHEDATTSTVPS